MNQKVELACNNNRRLDVELARSDKKPFIGQSRRSHDRGNYASTSSSTSSPAVDGHSFRGGFHYQNRSSSNATTNISSFSKSTGTGRRSTGNERFNSNSTVATTRGSSVNDIPTTTTDEQQEVKRERPKLNLQARTIPIEEIKVLEDPFSSAAVVSKQQARGVTPAATATAASVSVDDNRQTRSTTATTTNNTGSRLSVEPIETTAPPSSHSAQTAEESFNVEIKKKSKEERSSKREDAKLHKPVSTTQYQQQHQQRKKSFKDKKGFKGKQQQHQHQQQQQQNNDESKEDAVWKDPKKVVPPVIPKTKPTVASNPPLSTTKNAFAALALEDDDDDSD